MVSNIPALQNINVGYVLLQVAAVIATLLMTYLACHPTTIFGVFPKIRRLLSRVP